MSAAGSVELPKLAPVFTETPILEIVHLVEFIGFYKSSVPFILLLPGLFRAFTLMFSMLARPSS